MGTSPHQPLTTSEIAHRIVVLIMLKTSANERREALFEAYNSASVFEKRALFGVVATFFARCDGIPPAKAEASNA